MSTKALEMLVEKAEERAFREVHGTAMAEAARKEPECRKLAERMACQQSPEGRAELVERLRKSRPLPIR